MSNEIKEVNEKVGFLDRQMTRRQFLKISGKSLVGLTVAGSMLSLLGCTQEEIDDGAVTTWALPQGLLVVNEAKCTGCERCELNCSLVNDGVSSVHIARLKVSRNLHIYGDQGMYQGDFTYFPETCRQCEDPWCGNACPVGAIVTDDRGIRVVDESVCVGCGACVEACPWHMPTINPETNKSSKCIACGACVEGCPSGALEIIAWDAVTSAAQEIV